MVSFGYQQCSWVHLWGGVVSATLEAASQIIENGKITNVDDIIHSGIVGAVDGAASAVLGPIGGSIASGFISGVDSALEGNSFDQVVTDALVSTGFALAGEAAGTLVAGVEAYSRVELMTPKQLGKYAQSLDLVGDNFMNRGAWTNDVVRIAWKKSLKGKAANIASKATNSALSFAYELSD